jgi:hypothetical protein
VQTLVELPRSNEFVLDLRHGLLASPNDCPGAKQQERQEAGHDNPPADGPLPSLGLPVRGGEVLAGGFL